MPDKVEVLRRPADAQVMWLTAEQSNSSLIVDDAVMLKIFRSHLDRPASRSRDEPLSDVAWLRQRAGAAGRGEPHRPRRRAPCRWPWRRPSCATRAMPGPGRSNQANRAFDATASREASAEARGDDIRGLSCASPPRSAGSSATCMSCWRGRRTIRTLRRNAPPPPDVDALDRTGERAARTGVRHHRRARRVGITRPSRPRPRRCSANREALNAALRQLAGRARAA